MTDKVEKALGAALRGEAARYEKAPNRSPRIRVTLSVRRSDGGVAFRFEHTAVTISKLEAETAAKRIARQSGLVVWAVINVERIEE